MPTKKLRLTGKKATSPRRPPKAPKPGVTDDTYSRGWSNRTPNAKYVSHERGAEAMWQSGTL